MNDQFLDLIKNLPNLTVALAALWWSSRTIDKMLQHQQHLIDKLLEIARTQALISEKLNGYSHKPD